MREIFINFHAFWIFSFLIMGSCTHNVPVWDGKIYAGDSKKEGLSRNNPNQPPEFISAIDPHFDDFMAMTYADFKSFYATYVLGCKDWGTSQVLAPIQQSIEKMKAQVERTN